MSSTYRPPIFIIGTGRSGTSLVRRHLNAHPNIYLTFESNLFFFGRIFQRSLSNSDWFERYEQTLPFSWQNFDSTGIDREIMDSTDRGKLFNALLKDSAKRHGKSRYGDKTPTNGFHLDSILQNFPDAKIVHIVRNPYRVIQSLNQMPWSPNSSILTSLLIKKHFDVIAPYRSKILEIRFEDFLSNPKATLEEILAYTEEPWSDAVLKIDDFKLHEPKLPWLTHPINLAANSHTKNAPMEPSIFEEWKFDEICSRYKYATLETKGFVRSFGDLALQIPSILTFTTKLISILSKFRKQTLPSINQQAYQFYSLDARARSLYKKPSLEPDHFL